MPDWSALQFFNHEADLTRSANRLPHWQQEQSCLFLTFRLADSLPAHLLAGFREERENWLRHHPEPWDEPIEEEYHRRFSTVIDRWLDAGHGSCVLADSRCAASVRDALLHFDGTRCLQHGLVIMPNHVHLLFSLAENEDLGRLVGSWKSHSAKQINEVIEGSGTVWQKDYFDRLIRGPEHFMKVARYLRKNRESARSAVGYEAAWFTELLDS